jgi:hypothetical protein
VSFLTQHFIVEGKHLGTGPRKPERVHEQMQIPTSYAFFCPVCGDLWARCPVVNLDGTVQPWMPWRIKCRKHPPVYSIEVPGSLFLTWDKGFNDAMPEVLERWEFDRLLDCFTEESEMQ